MVTVKMRNERCRVDGRRAKDPLITGHEDIEACPRLVAILTGTGDPAAAADPGSRGACDRRTFNCQIGCNPTPHYLRPDGLNKDSDMDMLFFPLCAACTCILLHAPHLDARSQPALTSASPAPPNTLQGIFNRTLAPSRPLHRLFQLFAMDQYMISSERYPYAAHPYPYAQVRLPARFAPHTSHTCPNSRGACPSTISPFSTRIRT